MYTVTVRETVDAPIEDVWEAIDDFGNVYEFHPYVEGSRLINDVARGTGAKRQCDFYSGESIREEVVETVPGKRQVVDIFDTGSFPLEENVATFDLEAVADGRTRVTVEMTFRPKYGPVGWVMARVAMKRQFRSLLENVLRGLEKYLRTGQLIGEKGELVDEAHYGCTAAGSR